MSAVELSEKLLMEAGGWQAMKEARALCAAGRVTSAEYVPPLLKGVVRDAGTEFRAGFKIESRSKLENACSCRVSRQWGTVCAHSLAVGLEVLKPKPPVVLSPTKVVPVATAPRFTTAEVGTRAVLHIVLPPTLDSSWEKNAITVGVEAEHGGRRVLAHTLPPDQEYQVSDQDLRLAENLRGLNSGALPGMLILTRDEFLELAETARGHSRVTFGRSAPVDVAALIAKLKPAEVPPPHSVEIEAARPEFLLAIEGSLNHLSASLRAAYGSQTFRAGSPENPSAHAGKPARNLPAEGDALERLRRAGFSAPSGDGQLTLKGENAIVTFFARDLPGLQREWKVSIGARFNNVTKSIERIIPRIEITSSGEDWFDLSFQLATPGGQTFSASEIQRLLQMGQNHVRLRDNRLAVFDSGMLDELQNVLVDCNPHQRSPGTYRIDKMHAGYLDAVVADRAQLVAPPTWQTWTRAQRQMDKPEPVPLGDLENVLRNYQKDGVYWMHFLARNGLGGILADEMGLGKTVQALAFIRMARTPALIVCPSSLVYNWEREAARFAPELRCLSIVGPDRAALFLRIQESDLIITSYALLRRDLEQYRRSEFSTVVLDEAQHIKNPDTQNFQAAMGLRARTRFVLTGTPMENSVRDLWSIMEFLLPNYLGKRADFRERYEQPIQGGDRAAGERLTRRIRPFMLRRLKKTVATELPDKLEQVAYCELTAEQRGVYAELLNESRKQISDATGETNAGRKKLLMLTALLRLRQACCDLRLLKMPGIKQPSAKLELLDELLREAIDGGHRVLIFSQFVTMLQLIRDRLIESTVPFCYLDGATKKRGEEVDRFQASDEIPVFLISLKAGGTGLNLTRADTVIHFDPWWNPAVEAQATDRAHRIGQQSVVTSYKLITKGTVEEKILALQRRKRELIDATVESEEPMMSGLGMDEIEALFE
ncbi:MAG: hypothetical protein QOD99_110 [Chthoniobacter sp.]|jgi:superfamily II DNA or RNA helicase|nr:hypothetical protein [Chthoniobacter sp.]